LRPNNLLYGNNNQRAANLIFLMPIGYVFLIKTAAIIVAAGYDSTLYSLNLLHKRMYDFNPSSLDISSVS